MINLSKLTDDLTMLFNNIGLSCTCKNKENMRETEYVDILLKDVNNIIYNLGASDLFMNLEWVPHYTLNIFTYREDIKTDDILSVLGKQWYVVKATKNKLTEFQCRIEQAVFDSIIRSHYLEQLLDKNVR